MNQPDTLMPETREVYIQITPDGGNPYITPDCAKALRMVNRLMDIGLGFRVEYISC